MALVVKDRVKETAAAPGTGTVSLGGAASGFRPFSDIGSGNTTFYVIFDPTANTFEVGEGTYTSGSPDTLTRDDVLQTSANNTTKVNFANAVEVFIALPADKSVHLNNTDNLEIAGDLTVTSSNATDQIVMKNTNTGTDAAPDLVLWRDSASPANADSLGRIDFRGEDDGSTARNYTTIESRIVNVAASTPTGAIHFKTLNASTSEADVLVLSGDAATFSGSVTATTTVNVGTNGGFYFKQDSSESVIRSESQPIVLQTYASSAWQDRVTVRNSGNVGIGSNNSEEYPLFVKGSNISSGGGSATVCVLDSGTAYNSNPGGGITFRGTFNSSGSTTNFATVQGIKENTTDGNYASAIAFKTRANGGNLTEKLRIDSQGEATFSSGATFGGTVNIGTTGSLSNNSGTFLIDANTNINLRGGIHTFDNADGSVEYMRITSPGYITLPQTGILAFNSTSDEYITATTSQLTFGVDNAWKLQLDSQRLKVRTGSATGGTDTANVAEFYKNGETTVSQNVLVYSDVNGHSNGWAINMDENTGGGVSRQSNSYKSLFYFQDIRTNSSPNEKHNFGEWDGTNFKPICYFYTSTDGSNDNASNVEVLASGASTTNANAWLNIRSKGTYYGGLNYYSGSNHIFSQLAYRDGSSVSRVRSFVGGTGAFPQTSGVLATSIHGTYGDFGIRCDPETLVGLEVNGGNNIDASTGNVFTGRSDGGNGNNRRFNLIATADGNGTYGGGLRIQTRNNSNVFQDVVRYYQDLTSVHYGLIGAYGAGAVGLEVKGDGSGYTQGAIVLRSHPSSGSPEYRGQGVYLFNEGADENWYSGTVYNETTQHRWMVCHQSNSSMSYDTAQVTYCKFSVQKDGRIGVNNSSPDVTIHAGYNGQPNHYNAMRIGTNYPTNSYTGKIDWCDSSNITASIYTVYDGTAVHMGIGSLYNSGHNTADKFTFRGNGEFRAIGNVIAYYSDERLKDFHGKIEGALDKVKAINGYYYTENEKAKEFGFDKKEKQVGVSAQEVEKVLPEVVTNAPFDVDQMNQSRSGENYKTVEYEKLVPLLIEAMKEQQIQIDELKEKLNALTK